MSRLTLLVCLILALALTACVQPTPTPNPTAAATADSSGDPVVVPTNTPAAGYPGAEPRATTAAYPAPFSRVLARPHGSAARPNMR